MGERLQRPSPFLGKGYLLSAKGAVFISVWGKAPGILTTKIISAESAIQLCAWV